MIAIIPRFKLARGLRLRPLPRRTAVLIALTVSLSSGTGAKMGFRRRARIEPGKECLGRRTIDRAFLLTQRCGERPRGAGFREQAARQFGLRPRLRNGSCLLFIRLAGGNHSRVCKHALYFFNRDVSPIERRCTDTDIDLGGGPGCPETQGEGAGPYEVIEILVGPREAADLPSHRADCVRQFPSLVGRWVTEPNTDVERKTIVIEVKGIGRQTRRHKVVRHFENKARISGATILDGIGRQSRACQDLFDLRGSDLAALQGRCGETDYDLRRKLARGEYQAMLRPRAARRVESAVRKLGDGLGVEVLIRSRKRAALIGGCIWTDLFRHASPSPGIVINGTIHLDYHRQVEQSVLER